MSPTVDVQLNPACEAWPALRALAGAAEASGYGALWAYDHLAGASIDGPTMLETFTLLGALAVATSTIELGTLVANVTNRTPALLAVAAASVAAISGRPVHLGVGAGASPTSRWAAEQDAVGQAIEPTLAGRHRRLAEALDVLERVFDPDRPPELATFPLPDRRPTTLVGVNSAALATLAGQRADGVNVAWNGGRRDELLAAAVAARGGRPGFLLTAWAFWTPALADPDGDARREMVDVGLDRIVLVARPGLSVADLSRRPVR